MPRPSVVLYEYKIVDVYSPPPSRGAYYLQRPLAPSTPPPLQAALQDAMAQQVAQGWEFVAVEEIEVTQGIAYNPYRVSNAAMAGAPGIVYHLRFRRAKHP